MYVNCYSTDGIKVRAYVFMLFESNRIEDVFDLEPFIMQLRKNDEKKILQNEKNKIKQSKAMWCMPFAWKPPFKVVYIKIQ